MKTQRTVSSIIGLNLTAQKRQALSTLATIVAENEVAVFSRRFRRLVAEIIDY